ncbi:MAG: ABC transporter substrate-binding protein [Desulfosoma sp.]
MRYSRHGKRRVLRVLAAALWLTVIGAACQREPIKIGFSGTLTGPFSDLGIHGRNGARMAVEAINEAGGVVGRPLELVVMDDEGTPEGAVQADRNLAALGVAAIIGHMTSALSMAALPITQETGVPLVSPTTSTPLLKGRKDLFFRVQPTTDATARALARWITGKPSLKTVCTIRDTRNDAYSAPWEGAFVEEYVRLNGPHGISCRLTYGDTGPKVVEAVMSSLHVARPDALLLVSSGRDAAFFLRVFASEGIKSQILSSAWAQTEAFLAESGPLAENLFFASENMPTDSSLRLRNFSWQYRKRFGVAPSFAAVRAYEAVQLTASALNETAGRRDGLVKALSTPRTIDGLYGPLTIDSYGDASGPYFIVSVKEGRFVVLEFLPGASP